MLKRNIFLNILFVLFLCFGANVVYGETVYNGNDLEIYKNRTKKDIADKYYNAKNNTGTYSDGYYEIEPSVDSAPYSGGKLKQDTLDAMTNYTNFYRYLFGVSELKKKATPNEALQIGAVIRNYDFNHSVNISNKPEDMPEEFWNTGAHAGHNVLAYGSSPVNAVIFWINEGYNVASKSFDTLGHRELLIAPTISAIDYGYAGSVAIGGIREQQNTSNSAFYAYPPPGYMLNNIIYASRAAWSIRLNSSILSMTNGINGVTVTVTDLVNNTSYICTKSNGKLTSSYGQIGFAQPTTNRDGDYYYSGGKYKVEATGFKNNNTGEEVKIEYTTEFFSAADYANAQVSYVFPTDSSLKELYVPSGITTENLKQLMSLLPSTFSVLTNTGREIDQVFKIKGDWKLDETNQCFTNSLDTSNMPSYLSDPNGLFNKVSVCYKTGKVSSSAYFRSITSTTPDEGTTGIFKIMYYAGFPHSYITIYRTNLNNGKYTNTKVFDINSPGYNKDTTSCYSYPSYNIEYCPAVYTMDHTYTADDSGTYIAIMKLDNYSFIMDFVDIDVKTNMKNGLFYNDTTKRWEYYKNDEPDYTYTGYASNSDGTYYVENGIVTFEYNNLVKYNGKWTAIVNSKVQSDYTGLATNNNGSYYLENGVLSFKYNGTYKDSTGNIYILKNSKVDTSVTKLKSVGETWYYFQKGKTDLTYNGYATNNNGTYYLENGIVTFKFNKLVKYKGKWTAIVNSKIQPNYTGLSTNNTGSYYLKNGELTFKYNGTYKDSKGNVYILKNSKVDTSVTKLKSVGGTWYYFKNGKTDLTYTGLVSNSNGTYLVENGVITFKYNGKYIYNGRTYTIKNSKVVM